MIQTLILIVLILAAWDIAWWLFGVQPLFPWQLRRMQQAGEPVRIVDVRTAPEYEAFHIQDAQLQTDIFTNPDPLSGMDRDRPVVVVCMTGHRSPVAAKYLQKKGFHRVYNLTWGMLLWKLTGGKTVSDRK